MKQEKEKEKDRVILGDCLAQLKTFPEGCFDLIYLDPPFFTQKVHKLRTKDRSRTFSFRDIWDSNREYADFLLERTREMSRVLKPDGSLFFHCDKAASHLVRLILDEVFSPENFRSEIIWTYRRWSSAKAGLMPAHQTIFHYSKSDDFKFNRIYEDYSPATNVDQILQLRVRDESGKSVYKRDGNGNAVIRGGKKGVPLSDVWDMPYLNPKAKERTGYPTQKPVHLLERILAVGSNPGDRVLDPFCGSGTTLVAAKLSQRRFVGIDVSGDAVALSRKRLAAPYKSPSNLLATGRNGFKLSDEKLLHCLSGIDHVPVQRNRGIDAILKETLDGKPVIVKIQRDEETLAESVALLIKAASGKQAALMILIARNPDGSVEAKGGFHRDIRIIEAPALKIRFHLDDLRSPG